MRDFNFFDQLSGGKKKKTTTLTYVLSAVLLLVLALGGLSVYNILKLKDLRDENIALQEKVNDPTHQQDYNEVLAITTKTQELETEKLELDRIHGKLIESRRINSLLIKEIAMVKPEAVAIKSINFSQQGIDIEGTSINLGLIAKFEYNLRGNDRFRGPFVPSIDKSEDGDYYDFTLSFAFDIPEEIEEPEDIPNGEEPWDEASGEEEGGVADGEE